MDELARTRVVAKDAVLVAALAVRASEQAQGLQGRRVLRWNEALAFPYPTPRATTFHMGSVAYPIDVAFVGPDGRVAQLIEAALPGARDHWSWPSTSLVLETRAGRARQAGLVVGQSVALPRAAQGLITSPPDLAAALLEGLARSGVAPEWHPDRNNQGRTETAVLDAQSVGAWVGALELTPEGRAAAVAAATSPEGWTIIADTLILAGITDIARVVNNKLVLTRGRLSPMGG